MGLGGRRNSMGTLLPREVTSDDTGSALTVASAGTGAKLHGV